ncbi:putative cytidine deaminase [Cryptosporidium felis]|nr:putative cytidine deaminase [Cryptosporidium felis]
MDGTFRFEEVLPDAFYEDPEFAEFCSLRVPRRLANDFSKLLSGDQFTSRFPHLKRMRRIPENGDGDDLGVEVLIGESRDDIPPEAESFLENNGVPRVWKTLNLPKSPPLTREKYLELSRHWPLSYLKPRWTPEQLSPESQAAADKMIRLALRIGKMGEERGNPGRGCVITLKGKVAAVGEDRRNSCYPWMHSAMVAISNFSRRIRSSNGDRDSEDGAKQGDYGGGNVSVFWEEEALPDSEFKDQYLCTGGVAYLSHEPCISCSMALVHSRVSKVVYLHKDSEEGFLGSRYKLHCAPQLNHHYRVYTVFRGPSSGFGGNRGSETS